MACAGRRGPPGGSVPGSGRTARTRDLVTRTGPTGVGGRVGCGPGASVGGRVRPGRVTFARAGRGPRGRGSGADLGRTARTRDLTRSGPGVDLGRGSGAIRAATSGRTGPNECSGLGRPRDAPGPPTSRPGVLLGCVGCVTRRGRSRASRGPPGCRPGSGAGPRPVGSGTTRPRAGPPALGWSGRGSSAGWSKGSRPRPGVGSVRARERPGPLARGRTVARGRSRATDARRPRPRGQRWPRSGGRVGWSRWGPFGSGRGSDSSRGRGADLVTGPTPERVTRSGVGSAATSARRGPRMPRPGSGHRRPSSRYPTR